MAVATRDWLQETIKAGIPNIEKLFKRKQPASLIELAPGAAESDLHQRHLHMSLGFAISLAKFSHGFWHPYFQFELFGQVANMHEVNTPVCKTDAQRLQDVHEGLHEALKSGDEGCHQIRTRLANRLKPEEKELRGKVKSNPSNLTYDDIDRLRSLAVAESEDSDWGLSEFQGTQRGHHAVQPKTGRRVGAMGFAGLLLIDMDHHTHLPKPIPAVLVGGGIGSLAEVPGIKTDEAGRALKASMTCPGLPKAIRAWHHMNVNDASASKPVAESETPSSFDQFNQNLEKTIEHATGAGGLCGGAHH